MTKLPRLCETITNWDSLRKLGNLNQFSPNSAQGCKINVIVHNLTFLYWA